MIDNDILQKDDALIHQIYVTMRLFTKNLNDVISPYDIYSSEWTIINYLHHHEAISQADLATALQIEPAAVSKTIGKMEKKGLVTRSSAKDKREKHISMTISNHNCPAPSAIPHRHFRTITSRYAATDENNV